MMRTTTSLLIPVLPYGRVDNVLYSAKIGFAPEILSLDRLEEILKDAARENSEITFPSHFFEYPGNWKVLQKARALGLSVRIQVSAGMELIDFFDEMLKLSKFGFSVDLIVDRDTHAWDVEKLLALQKTHGAEVRAVFCPTRDFDPIETLKKLREVVPWEIFLYFAPKRSPQDRFLTQDEVFLLLPSLRSALPDEPTVIQYRSETPYILDAEELRAKFADAGRFPRFRRAIQFCARNAVLRPALVAIFYAAWVLRTPLPAIQGIGGRIWRRLRYGVLMKVWHACRYTAWNRFWYSLPRLYLILRYPFAKVYWFSEYQFQKRVAPRLPWTNR